MHSTIHLRFHQKSELRCQKLTLLIKLVQSKHYCPSLSITSTHSTSTKSTLVDHSTKLGHLQSHHRWPTTVPVGPVFTHGIFYLLSNSDHLLSTSYIVIVMFLELPSNASLSTLPLQLFGIVFYQQSLISNYSKLA